MSYDRSYYEPGQVWEVRAVLNGNFRIDGHVADVEFEEACELVRARLQALADSDTPRKVTSWTCVV